MNASSHLVLGGQRSGKSRRAEQFAAAWLAGGGGRTAVLLATALAGDDEMRDRIARHRRDRAERVPGLGTHEVPCDLGEAIRVHTRPDRLVVVDCLTLWLTNLLMPMDGAVLTAPELAAASAALVDAVCTATGPVVLVSNEIGLGLSPMTREARHFVDALGALHQTVAAVCTDVTLMVAGIEVPVKRKEPTR